MYAGISDLRAASQMASTSPFAAAPPHEFGETADDEKHKPSGKKTPAAENGTGRVYRDGKYSFTVTKVKKGMQRVGNEYIGEEAPGHFVLVHVTVENIRDQPRTFTDSNQRLYDTADRRGRPISRPPISMGDQSKAQWRNRPPR